MPHSSKRKTSKDQTAQAVDPAAICSAQDVDPYQSEDYQRYLAECAKHCHCDHDICDSVLAGGPCEGRIRDEPDDDEPDFTVDDLEWSERYPHLV
jgi:hypothetical protein